MPRVRSHFREISPRRSSPMSARAPMHSRGYQKVRESGLLAQNQQAFMKGGCSNWRSMPMGDDGFLRKPVNDPRLAPYATSAQPAWLWSTDGSRILWCNPAGAAVLGISDLRRLEKPLSPTNPHRREVAQLGRRLGAQTAPRLERMRSFASRLGQLVTCNCSQLITADGEPAILLVRMEPFAGPLPQPTTPPPPPTFEVSAQISPEPPIREEVPLAAIAPAEVASEKPLDVEEPLARDETVDGDADAADVPLQVTDAPEDTAVAVLQPPGPSHDPLRFVWQIDAHSRFVLTSDDFVQLAGHRTAAVQGRRWREVATALELDPDRRIDSAIDNGETFSGIALSWPLNDQSRGRVELSGMPIYDTARNFAGYRGFGIYRPQASLPELFVSDPEFPSEPEFASEPEFVAEPASEPAPDEAAAFKQDVAPAEPPATQPSQDPPSVAAAETSAAPDENLIPAETEIVEPPQNVVPFPFANDTRGPTLSAVENHAFDEIARRLTQKFDELSAQRTATTAEAADVSERHEPAQPEQVEQPAQETSAAQPAWLAAAATPARGDSTRERMLLDLMPSGILIYRLDRLLYTNRAFLERTGFASLHALQEAGGLDALYVEPSPGSASSASDDGMPLTIAHSADDHAPSDARLFSILWDDDTAHALILQDAKSTAAPAVRSAGAQPAAAPQPAGGSYDAILETATDGIILFDRSGAIISSNRSAQRLFDMSPNELAVHNFAELFATESQRVVLDYFESLDGGHDVRPHDHGREVLARERKGSFVPLSMTMGRTDGDHYFAVFRDLSQLRQSETDLLNARRNAERATSAKTDALARISREIRDPLNTIIGFASVMIEEKFGELGNERYAAYLKDIRAAGERAIAVLDDIVNISGIESGQAPLKLVSQNLNEVVEQCVGVLQPQANRERVIIRTSLARALPQVLADTQALRQITMNIVTSSIRCSRAGGQVIVSTAPSESGGAILRVRDTGRGLSAAGLASSPVGDDGELDRGAVDLSLARALAEANRAHFQIKSTDNAGTLIEVAFANTRALAG
jgi:PAS domain S-box-containing protein